MSQPREHDYRCRLCRRCFGSQRGLTMHLNSCRRKYPANEFSQPVNEVISPTTLTIAARSTMYIWGNHTNDDLKQIVILILNNVLNSIYEETVFWRKNLFMLPSALEQLRKHSKNNRCLAMNCSSLTLSDIVVLCQQFFSKNQILNPDLRTIQFV